MNNHQFLDTYFNGLYKDEQLTERMLKSLFIDRILDNKKKRGQNLELNDIDRIVISNKIKEYKKRCNFWSTNYFLTQLEDALEE